MIILFLLLTFLPAQAITYEIDKKLPYPKAIEKAVKDIAFIDKHIEIKRGFEYGGYGWHKDSVAYIGKLGVKSPKEYYINIVLHEIFHVLGAKHNDNPLSIMYHGDLSQASVLDSDLDIL